MFRQIFTTSMTSFRPDSKILILSGSHGSEDGISGLTDKSIENVDEGYGFYREDCELLGIKPGPHKRSQRLPLRNWNGIPDITKPAEKVVTNHDRFLKDNCNLQDLDIRICNVCYYHGNSEKLLEEIKVVKEFFEYVCIHILFFNQIQPALIAVAFCFSRNSDVSMMFRRYGIFSEMIITHDIRCITRRPDATLSTQQNELISMIGKTIYYFPHNFSKRKFL